MQLYDFEDRVPMDPRNMDKIKLYALDPNNEDILYSHQSTYKFVWCNIRTKMWSKIEQTWKQSGAPFLPLILHPLWATPVPALTRQRSVTRSSNLFNKTLVIDVLVLLLGFVMKLAI